VLAIALAYSNVTSRFIYGYPQWTLSEVGNASDTGTLPTIKFWTLLNGDRKIPKSGTLKLVRLTPTDSEVTLDLVRSDIS
jgi:hypothetical protein